MQSFLVFQLMRNKLKHYKGEGLYPTHGKLNRNNAKSLSQKSGESIQISSSAGKTIDICSLSLSAGDRIVFTGQLTRSQTEWIESITKAGLTAGGISKSTKLVVAYDTDSLSTKAAKAREYGIPVIDEQPFEHLFQDYRSSHKIQKTISS